jgi:putative CocE/NonD family hydrolase
LSNVSLKYLKGTIPTWNDYVAHPDYDEFWRRQTMVPHLTSVTVPTLNVAGWWDQEDFYGPIRIYDELEKHDTQRINYLVVGPWNHGGWSRGAGDKLGPISFDSPTGEYFRAKVQAPFFAYFLKDKGARDFPEALTFEAGTNQWRRWDAWPPRQAQAMNLYFRTDGGLSFAAPTDGSAQAFDAYLSDPAHPVPYRHRPIQPTYFAGGSGWPTWLVEDQRFVTDRADVLSFESQPLTDDLTIAGEVVADLFASTTGTDADWIVKLIDVYPEEYPDNWSLAGYELMVSNEVFRGRYRKSFEQPVATPEDSVVEYRWSLHTQDYTFKRGHRIMVQVQSTWFPIIDRNPQTYVPNIFEARAEDFRAQTQRIYRSAQYPSHVTVPVVVH